MLRQKRRCVGNWTYETVETCEHTRTTSLCLTSWRFQHILLEEIESPNVERDRGAHLVCATWRLGEGVRDKIERLQFQNLP